MHVGTRGMSGGAGGADRAPSAYALIFPHAAPRFNGLGLLWGHDSLCLGRQTSNRPEVTVDDIPDIVRFTT